MPSFVVCRGQCNRPAVSRSVGRGACLATMVLMKKEEDFNAFLVYCARAWLHGAPWWLMMMVNWSTRGTVPLARPRQHRVNRPAILWSAAAEGGNFCVGQSRVRYPCRSRGGSWGHGVGDSKAPGSVAAAEQQQQNRTSTFLLGGGEAPYKCS